MGLKRIVKCARGANGRASCSEGGCSRVRRLAIYAGTSRSREISDGAPKRLGGPQ